MIRILLALLVLALPAAAQPQHALTILGTPALPPDFKYFPYVNPDAPKGGEVVFGMNGSFDGFNPFILRGNPAMGVTSIWNPGVGGTSAGTAGGHVWESLMVSSADEVATAYGHLAESIEVAPDKLSVAFVLRPEARFADGSPVLASDVAWTFKTLMEKGRPSVRVAYADVLDCVAEGERRVVFHFKSNQNRELPLAMGGLPVMSEKWWSTRDFTKPLTEPPMGSGPYRVESFELGRTVTYARRDDWWAKDRPTGRGQFNFDRVRIEYFRDLTVIGQALKAGQLDYRQENSAKEWATGYDVPAVRDGLLLKQELPHRLPLGYQAFVFNTRRPVFKDMRVREAINELFDYEWLNKNLFFGSYVRTTSYFGNTDQESHGLPEGAELAVLERFRDKLPARVFTQPFQQPMTDASGNNREGLRRALALFKEAGWTIRDRKLVNAEGKQMSFGIVLNEPGLERLALPFQQWLQRAGIEVSVRTVDTAQYQRLMDDFDFDFTPIAFPGGDLLGNELRDDFSCHGGQVPGGGNYAGVCDPVVDALIETIINATDRDSLFAAGRALDRVLLAGLYGVMNYHSSTFRQLVWNRFGRPTQPVRTGFVIDNWWVDPALAAKTDAARKPGQ